MPEPPIIFSAPMIRALIAGRKIQTRRMPQPTPAGDGLWHFHNRWGGISQAHQEALTSYIVDAAARYAVGDRLWVRENWQTYSILDSDAPSALTGIRIWYGADEGYKPPSKVRPSIHMPRWASRLTLTVTGVKVERLQDISEEDARAEGVHPAAVYGGQAQSWLPAGDLRETFHLTAKEAFKDLWGRINGPESWEANPWVVAVSFEVRRGNIDSLGEQ
ncbi:hypothetical protein [Microvirga tunisiensis]|uniref:ASCH domain-containing protein n=1 Tax=Microvirga tunisiensis TaxID=2108360 RepID=A0A5N7MV28_9HYPH|nr:hypothetical protein [Microvirga tunisiensis]MPR12871.1 hypothetical protein [Microvirga tunisiensis]MPR30817.1 hypothetical protein [Microvirga tunisiensis]